MAHATDIHVPHRPLLADWRETFRTRRAQNRVYRRTLNELRHLSERELADIGIHRSMIKEIAMEAAYGK